MNPGFCVIPVPGIPMIQAGDDLATAILTALRNASVDLQSGDVLAIAQKIVSKAEGRLVFLAEITPSPRAIALAAETEKDPRIVELILSESSDLLRKKPGVMIMRHRLGLVGAHAGIDQSNIDHSKGEAALLLPEDPDRAAAALREQLEANSGQTLGVIITDSLNRPWRLGTLGTAIGSAGIPVLEDYRGDTDIYGRELKVTLINRADAMAAAAVLVMGETVEKIPVVILRGFDWQPSDDTARDIIRPQQDDLFT